MEVIKEYNYEKNGKNVCIKRSYTIKGTKGKKISDLDAYFTKNADTIKSSKKLRDVLASYNDEHEDKISFSMLYQKYKTVFGSRRQNKAVMIETNVSENESENDK